MEIGKKDLIRINREFGGRLVRGGSIDFALARQESKRLGPYKKLAYLWRAILVDHPFTDGNKRTAVFLALAFAENEKKRFDRDLLVRYAIAVAKGNITSIRNIEWRLRNAIT